LSKHNALGSSQGGLKTNDTGISRDVIVVVVVVVVDDDNSMVSLRVAF
jgi:hypothetical protein